MSSGGYVPPHVGYTQLEAAARKTEHDQDRQPEKPSGFAVSASRGLGPRVRGELLISPGSIVFSPFKGDGSGDFAHSLPSITMTNVWFWPPWADTFLILQNDTGSLRIGAPAFVRRRLKDALGGSGIALVEQSSWRAPRLPVGSPHAG